MQMKKKHEQLLPILLAQGRRHGVDLLQAGLLEGCLVVQGFGLQLDAFAVDVQEPQWWVTGVFGQAGYLSRIRGVSPDAELARATESRITKAVERRVLALVLVVLLACLLDEKLDFVVGQRRCNVLEVVLNHFVFPA